jgi:hypothetical protein
MQYGDFETRDCFADHIASRHDFFVDITETGLRVDSIVYIPVLLCPLVVGRRTEFGGLPPLSVYKGGGRHYSVDTTKTASMQNAAIA